MKKRIDPNKKGGRFEREICKKLSLWVSDNEREDIFWRSATSGGRATVAFKKGLNFNVQAGDICYVDSLGKSFVDVFFIECKHYKKLDFDNLFFQTNKQGILGFWYKYVEEANKYSKLPFLVVKQNNKPIMLLLSKKGLKYFNAEKSIIGSIIDLDLYVFNFEQFTNSYDVKILEIFEK